MISGLRREHISKRVIGALIIVWGAAISGSASLAASKAALEHSLPRVEGNQVFSKEQILSLLDDAGWRSGQAERAIGALQSAYYREGFLFATLHLRERGNETVVVIDEGEPARYGRVRLHGAKGYSEEEIRDKLGIGSGLRFRPRELDGRIDELLKQYDADGFPFAQIWVDSMEMHPDERKAVDVVLYLVEGGKKRLRNVEIEGLVKTRKQLVVELSGLKPGESYTGRSIDDAYLRLRSCGIFEDVAYPKVRLSPEGDGVEALLVLQEPRRFNSFSSALGYAKEEGGDDDVLSGTVRLNLQNIGGTLRDLSIFWNNDGSGRNETRLNYKDRFIFGRNLSLSLSLEQIGLDTLYTWQSAGILAERPFARIAGSLLTLKWALYVDRNVFSEGDLLRSWRARLASGFSYLKGAPWAGGLSVDGQFTWAQKRFYTRSDPSGQFLSQYIAELEGSISVDFTRLFHLRNETVYKGLESSEDLVPLSEQFYLGGARTLRGYRENQFHGRRIAYTRSELVIGKRRVDHAYLFADGGYIFQETVSGSSGVDRRNLFRVGYGFGLRTASKLGKVDISFGIGERLSLRQTKVHVILEQTF